MKHPNLLNYISAWYEDNKNRVIIITELLQGGNLREHRKYQKNLKIKLIKKWIKQLLSALDYLHNNDYIHHDIKCQNILVDRISGNLKLGDLVFAEKLGDREYFTKYVGTEEFMAPEIKDGKYTFKADIYSLGLALIQLITMEKPYKEFQRKINIYEAKKKGEYPLSFNQIKNEEIKNFISLCLKEESERPTCKELLSNKWLNDNESSDHNAYVEIINNLRQQNFILDKNSFIGNIDINQNEISSFSSNCLYNPKILKQSSISSMGPIYSLDTSKLNCRSRMNSFKLKKTGLNNQSIKTINSIFSKSLFPDRTIPKHNFKSKSIHKFYHRDSSDLLRQEIKIKNNNLITIYLYIIEIDYNIYFILKKNQEQKENILFSVKIIISQKKWKNIKLPNENIGIEYDYNGEQKSMEKIINNLKKIIDLTKNDILLIKKRLNGKISKIIKEKKMRDLKDKINKILRNYEFLLNNEDFDYLECPIHKRKFHEEKFPKEISDKVKIYKKKKNNIENLFCLHNLNINEDYNNNIILFVRNLLY